MKTEIYKKCGFYFWKTILFAYWRLSRKVYLGFCAELYGIQRKNERYFVHENELGSAEWQEPGMVEVASNDGSFLEGRLNHMIRRAKSTRLCLMMGQRWC